MTIQPQQNFTIPTTAAGKTEAASSAPRPSQEPTSETLLTPNLEALRTVLAEEVEIRPLDAARAMIWAHDPDYPPLDRLNGIAAGIVAEAIRHL